MRLEIKVTPKASRDLVKEEAGRWKVYLTAAPEKDKANKALVELLARHFNVPKASVRILRGHHSSLKTVEIA